MNFNQFVKLLHIRSIFFFAFAVSGIAQSESVNIPSEWKTVTENTGYRETPRYQQTISYAKRLDAASPEIAYKSFGKSSEGRDLPLLIAARNGEFTPRLARESGKALILIQAAIHAGESDGKDAGLALFRDIAITKERSALLNNAVILFVPIYNVDGHELFGKFNRINQNGPEKMGFRANSANQNLNRDYLKADTPETRAWLKLWNDWDPDFFIDCHVTDGADFRYNITYEFAHHNEIDTGLRSWMLDHFEKRVIPKVEAEGNLLSRYIQMLNPFEPERGIATFIATPRFATGYTPVRDRIGLLIEAHSVKPYKARVRGTYDVLFRTVEEIGNNKDSLFEVNRAADENALKYYNGRGESPEMPLSQRIGNKQKEHLFKGFEIYSEDSAISGGKRIVYTDKPKDYLVPQYDDAVSAVSVRPPLLYIVPPQWREVIERLDAHGIRSWRLEKETSVRVESFRFTDPTWRNAPFEGRVTMSFKAQPLVEERTFPANSVVIPVSQRAGKVAVHFLEPEGPDSAMFWGFFNAIFEQKEYSESYVMESIAEEMLEKDGNLKAEFAEKLKDPAFASDSRERLRFLYERSPYFDQRIGLYPVGRVVDSNEAKLLSRQ